MNRDELSTKMRIVSKAVEMIKSNGYSKVSVGDICKELEITRSAFYYYFKTKDEVFDYYLLTPELYISENILPFVATGSPLELFFQIFGMFTQSVEEIGPEIIRLVFKRNLDGSVSNMIPHHITMWKVYLDLIQRAQAAGEIPTEQTAETIVETAVHLSIGVSLRWCNQNAGFSYSKECLRLIKAAIQ